MNLEEFLCSVHGKPLYLTCRPEVADFTTSRPVSLVITRSDDSEVEIKFPSDINNLKLFCGKISHYLLSSNVIIGWNLKNLFSYIRAKTGRSLDITNENLYDLKILEQYIGLSEVMHPKSFTEAKARLFAVMKHSSWPKLKNIWGQVYIPMIVSTIPELESVGIIKNKEKLHAHYEIASQANGRMKCTNLFTHSYNPHTISDEEKEAYKPPIMDGLFMVLDIKHMEVSVLQWLSGDKKLSQILDSGQDLYDGIWKEMTGIDSTPEFRKKCKGIFLPVVYGLGPTGLGKNQDFSFAMAQKLIGKIQDKFSGAMTWVKNQQDSCAGGFVSDYFGRVRAIDEPYKARNFAIQSPAALLCFEKLIQLQRDLDKRDKEGVRLVEAVTAFHVHDGYGIYTNQKEVRTVAGMAKKSLESESSLFPGLKLKVSCKYGRSLLFKGEGP